MKKAITITMTIDSDTRSIESLDYTEDTNIRTKLISEGVDDSISVNDACQTIRHELEWYIEWLRYHEGKEKHNDTQISDK